MRRLGLLLVLSAACGNGDPPAPPRRPEPPSPEPPPATGVPERVRYEQILIAFRGSYSRTDIFRTREEARELARSILERARTGFDFEALKQEFSDDRNQATGLALGPYDTVREDLARYAAEIPRTNLYTGLANVVYALKVGEVGLVEHDPKRCPIGWIVVKRIE
jgi:hypothetical protein